MRRGKEKGVLVLEGARLVDEARARGLVPEVVLVSDRRDERAAELAGGGLAVRRVADSLLASVSGLRTAPGELALVPEPRSRGLGELAGADDALVVVAGVQDPGNLGALARTAEAAGARALVRPAGACSPWNEKALRGSMGSLLRLAVIEVASAEEAWLGLAELGFRQVVARTRGGVPPEEIDWSGRVALWVTAETGALPADLAGLAGRVADALAVTIPMAPAVESLNATAAAAVILFAARRAREAT
ncbi:MAG: RNA methyltransferase [Myxococcota bacterium]